MGEIKISDGSAFDSPYYVKYIWYIDFHKRTIEVRWKEMKQVAIVSFDALLDNPDLFIKGECFEKKKKSRATSSSSSRRAGLSASMAGMSLK